MNSKTALEALMRLSKDELFQLVSSQIVKDSPESVPLFFRLAEEYLSHSQMVSEILSRYPDESGSLDSIAADPITYRSDSLKAMANASNYDLTSAADPAIVKNPLVPFFAGMISTVVLYLDPSRSSQHSTSPETLCLMSHLNTPISTGQIRSNTRIELDGKRTYDRFDGISNYVNAIEGYIANHIGSGESIELREEFSAAPSIQMALLGIAFGLEQIMKREVLSQDQIVKANQLRLRAYELSGLSATNYVSDKIAEIPK